jgi:uncharacterized protein (TIGR03067 family)
MSRKVLLVAVSLLTVSGAQERLPPGPPPGPTEGTPWLVEALFVQANMVEGGQVLILAPSEDAKSSPSILVKADGKAVRAFGTDRRPLDVAELNRRLTPRAAAVVVHGQPPDRFFLKALNDHAVVLVVPKKLFDQMAKSAGVEPLPGWWNVNAGEKGATTGEHWTFDGKKVGRYRDGKLESYMAYTADATGYPKTIDLTPDRGPSKGEVIKGIYELDGNTLRICYASPDTGGKAERPKEFGAKGTVTVVFERLAP